jgi:hypothetical protein
MNDFFATIYENDFIGFFAPGFSEEIFGQFLYQKYGLTLLISVVVFVFGYYKLLDKPMFAKLIYWLIALIVAVVFNIVFLRIDAEASLTAAGFEFDGEYLSLAIVNGIFAALLFFVISIIAKFFSVNTSKIPF